MFIESLFLSANVICCVFNFIPLIARIYYTKFMQKNDKIMQQKTKFMMFVCIGPRIRITLFLPVTRLL